MSIKLRYLSFLIVFLIVGQNCQAQFEIPPKPNFQTSVYDYIGVLTPNEFKTLEQKLIRYADSTSTQIVLATISSTEGEYINYLATNWAQRWGIGQDKKDNGVFILLAKNDRKINISTGYGVEHLLTDKMCSRIIQEHIIPSFKKNKYAHVYETLVVQMHSSRYKGTLWQISATWVRISVLGSLLELITHSPLIAQGVPRPEGALQCPKLFHLIFL